MGNKVQFTVEFDQEVWASMTDEQRSDWVNRVNDVLSDEVYVSGVQTIGANN